MTDEEYKEHITKLIADMATNPGHYLIAENLAHEMVADHPDNQRVLAIVKRMTGITPLQLTKAITRLAKQAAAAAGTQQHQAGVESVLGRMPDNERDYVRLFVACKRWQLTYKGECFRDGEKQEMAELIHDAKLTASDLNLVKPRGEQLGVEAIRTAVDEWINEARREGRQAVWHAIEQLPGDRQAEDVLAAWGHACGVYFAEPEFSEAAIRNGIWRVKRKLAGLAIKDHYMIVLYGPQQGIGKTTIVRHLLSPVASLAIDTTFDQILDDRNTYMRGLFAANLDEMSKAERADISDLKNIITANEITSRILYTHQMQQTEVNVALFGTNNKRLPDVVFDATGMRRFIELVCRDRSEVSYEQWQEIDGFDWLALWQAVDHLADDPIVPFLELLKQKQEAMRARGTVESWVEQFEFDPNSIANLKKHEPGEYFEIFSRELYDIFGSTRPIAIQTPRALHIQNGAVTSRT